MTHNGRSVPFGGYVAAFIACVVVTYMVSMYVPSIEVAFILGPVVSLPLQILMLRGLPVNSLSSYVKIMSELDVYYYLVHVFFATHAPKFCVDIVRQALGDSVTGTGSGALIFAGVFVGCYTVLAPRIYGAAVGVRGRKLHATDMAMLLLAVLVYLGGVVLMGQLLTRELIHPAVALFVVVFVGCVLVVVPAGVVARRNRMPVTE